jgi:hypothetical protein
MPNSRAFVQMEVFMSGTIKTTKLIKYFERASNLRP